jgi:hexosaminidase
MRKFFPYLFCLCFSASLFGQQVSIIPKPVSLQVNSGIFNLTPSSVIIVPQDADRKSADFLNIYLQEIYGFKLPVIKAGTKGIRVGTSKSSAAKGAYTLNVNDAGVSILGDSPEGTFYGIQTLIQLLPVQKSASLAIPFVAVKDEPRFSYRGLHLDVGRHMFPVSFIKKYIDYIALHKMNYFHWHLTEDQGWRIEIKKYPNLTQTGAYRSGTIIGRHPGTGNDKTRYGGFYTQNEVKEVVKYASDRHINVIPEIEMPGHASAALASYPFLGCPGAGPFKVEETWGVFDDIFCAGKDSTFKFLQDVLDEVIPLFPAKYIHVGGDEAPKTNWKTCALCQKRIRDNNLKDEHGLQSYFIQRIEKYINSKGKTIIGWDEILEGGLAPNAIVMSWRGEAGGIEAAKQNHQVIMTPGSHVYLDHSQSMREDSVTIGGYTTVEKTYSYEPVPKELNAEQAKYVMGAQGNVWTEYMRYPRKVEYQIFPRLSALSEVLWSPKEQRSWSDFEPRLIHQFKRYDLWGSNYSKAYYEITSVAGPELDLNGLIINFSTRDREGKIKYRVNGGKEQNYTFPFAVKQKAVVTGYYYDKQGAMIDSVSLNLDVNKATGKRVALKAEPATNFPGAGGFTLVDGLLNEKGGRTIESIGYQADIEAVVDLNTPQQINSVVVHALNSGGTYVYPPKSVSIYGSTDGTSYRLLGKTESVTEVKGPKAIIRTTFSPETTRYIKVVVERTPVVPQGKRGAGESTWVYLDEIQIN